MTLRTLYATGLQQKRLDTSGVNEPFLRGPGEDGEAAVLGGDEGEGVRLVLDEPGAEDGGGRRPRSQHPGLVQPIN